MKSRAFVVGVGIGLIASSAAQAGFGTAASAIRTGGAVMTTSTASKPINTGTGAAQPTKTIYIACPTVKLAPDAPPSGWTVQSTSTGLSTHADTASGQLGCRLTAAQDIFIFKRGSSSCPSFGVIATPTGTSAVGMSADGYSSVHASGSVATQPAGSSSGNYYCKGTVQPSALLFSRPLPSGGSCTPNGPYFKCAVPSITGMSQ